MSKADRRARKQRNKQMAQERRYARWRRNRRQRWLARGLVAVLVAALIGGVVAALVGGGGKQNVAASGTSTSVPESTTTTALPADLAAITCTTDKPKAAGQKKPTFDQAPAMQIDPSKQYQAVMDTSCGQIVIDLDAKDAPNTVNSFVFLAQKGFYDGLTFHRVVSGFVIQGGDPKGDGTGGPGYTLAEEPPKDGKYQEGDVAMAKTQAAHSTGSQFFIVTGDPTPLDQSPTYSILGHVTAGLKVAQRIEHLEVPGTQKPSQPVYIDTVTIQEH